MIKQKSAVEKNMTGNIQTLKLQTLTLSGHCHHSQYATRLDGQSRHRLADAGITKLSTLINIYYQHNRLSATQLTNYRPKLLRTFLLDIDKRQYLQTFTANRRVNITGSSHKWGCSFQIARAVRAGLIT